MAINLNLAKYGDQFKAFENFARENANNMDALARIGGDGLEGALLAPDGKPRAIVAKTDDDKIKRFKQNLFFSRNADQKALNTAVRKLFLDTVLKICGVEKVKDLPPAVRKVLNEGDFGNAGHPLSARRIQAVTEAIRVEAAGPIPISGKAANEILGVILPGSGLENAKHPGLVLKQRMNDFAIANVSTYVARGIEYLKGKDGKLDLDKYTETFEKDMSRKFKVQIANGPFVWEKGVKEARDAYVSFLTDGQVTAYEDADKKTKLKACTLMILTTQGVAGCAVKAVGHAFDANGNALRIGANKQSGSNSREDRFNIAKDENGNITVECDITFPSPNVTLMNAKGSIDMYPTNQGSSFAYHMKVTISPESLDKFADADWEDFNSQEVKNIEFDNTRPHCFEEAAKALPGDTKLGISADVSFNVQVDSLGM